MTFAEKFAKNQGQPIEVDGRRVVPMLRCELRPGDRVHLTWRKSIDSPVQGIRLKVHGGSLTIDGKELADAVLWRDSAPDESVILYSAARPAELRIWNCWRDDRGVMQAWVGNAGMRIVNTVPEKLIAECNCRSEVTFDDLVFDVVIERSPP